MRMFSPITTELSWPRRAWSPLAMVDVMNEFDQVFDALSKSSAPAAAAFQPTCDVSEGENHFVLSVDVPGVKTEDLKIETRANQITISGERRGETSDHAERVVERTRGRFERTFTLPQSIAVDRIEAHHQDGVLTVTLPKIEAEKPRTIAVQSGRPGFLGRLLNQKGEAGKVTPEITAS